MQNWRHRTHQPGQCTDVDPLTLAQRAAAGDLDPEAVQWLAAGFRRFLGAGDSLELALGLRDSARMQARNQHLTAAAALIDAGRGVEPFPLAGELALAVKRFKGRGTSGDKAVDQCLQAAAATGARPICTQRALYDLLKL